MSLRCRVARRRLTASLADRQDAAGSRRLEAHLERCAACRQESEHLRESLRRLREELADPGDSTLGEGSWTRIRFEILSAARRGAPPTSPQTTREAPWRPTHGVPHLALRGVFVALLLSLAAAGFGLGWSQAYTPAVLEVIPIRRPRPVAPLLFPFDRRTDSFTERSP